MKNIFSQLTFSCGVMLLVGLASVTARADSVAISLTGSDSNSVLATGTITATFNAQTSLTEVCVNLTTINARASNIGFFATSPLNSGLFQAGSIEQTNVSGTYTFVAGGSVQASSLSNQALDFFVTTSNSQNPTFNGGGGGIDVNTTGEVCFTFSGNFNAAQLAPFLVVRFQSITGRGNVTSDVGTVTPTAPIPEPATMILLGTGLAGVAAKMRKRRGVS